MIKRFIYLASILCVAAIGSASAQGGEYYTNGKGQPFLKKQDIDIEGDPYLVDKWLPGQAQTTKGVLYDNVKLKYDLQDDIVTFVYDTADQPMKFAEPIKSFAIFSTSKMVFSNGYPAIDKQTEGSYYQVIASGKATLLKRVSKIINETKVYNSTNVTRSFQPRADYYLYKDNKIEKVDPKKALYSLAGSKKADLDNYMKSNTLSFKKDEDLAKLFDYYNAKLI